MHGRDRRGGQCFLPDHDHAGAGLVTARIEFDGDAGYGPSSASVDFTITTEEVSLTYTGPTYGKKGKTITVSAKLRHDGTMSRG